MKPLPPDPTPKTPPAATPSRDAAALPRISSEQLFPAGSAELIIDHRGALYRLKQTSLGKLILTK